MLRRHVERFEVVVIVFELRAFGDVETHPKEDLFDTLAQQRERMPMTDERRAPGKRDVDRVNDRSRERGVGEPRLQRLFDVLLEEIRIASERRPLVWRRGRDVFEECGDQPALAGQIAISQRAQVGLARRRGELTLELRFERRNPQRRQC
jgi:hypothetical protein